MRMIFDLDCINKTTPNTSMSLLQILNIQEKLNKLNKKLLPIIMHQLSFPVECHIRDLMCLETLSKSKFR